MRHLLSRHLILEWLGVTLLGLVLLVLGLWTLQAARLAPVFFRAGLEAGDFLVLALTLLPSLVRVTFPLAVALGLLATFARWQRDGEWTALMTLGVNRRRLVWPVLLVCAAAALVQLSLSHWIAPRALAAAETRLRQGGLRAVVGALRPGQFNPVGETGLLYVREQASDGGWEAPFWVQERAGARDVLRARHARLDLAQPSPLLRLTDGEWEREGGGTSTHFRFAQMDLPLSGWLDVNTFSEPLTNDWERADAAQLRDFQRDCPSPRHCVRMAGEFSRRNASAAVLFLVGGMGLLALGGPLLRRPSAAYALTAGLLLAYYLLERLGMTLGEKGVWPPFWGPWLPVLLGSAGLVLWQVWKRE